MGIVEMNISASLMIVVTILLREKLLKYLPNAMFCALWFFIVLRLIIPFSVTSQFSIFNLYDYLKEDVFYEHNAFDMTQTQIANVTEITETYDMVGLKDIFVIIWLLGFGILMIRYIYFYINHIFIAKRALQIENNAYPAQWIAQQKIFRRVPVKLSSDICTPVSMGILFPVILLPYTYDTENKECFNHLLCHESMHIKYHHSFYKLILQIVVALHWFNPFVHIMIKYVIRDMEIFCDRKVIAFFQLKKPLEYAKSILTVANEIEFKEQKTKRAMFLHSGFTESAVIERVSLLMNWKKTTVFAATFSCAVVMSMGSVFATTSISLSEEKKEAMVISKQAVEEITVNQNVVDEVGVVVLTEEDMQYIEESMERASKYLIVRNYKYTQYGSIPSQLNVSLEKDGYTYKGTLDLDDYIYESATDKYTGYYSGKIYR